MGLCLPFDTFACSAKASSLASICACSDLPTACAEVRNACDHGIFWKRSLFSTAHQIGTVFDNASGMLFPRLVESTMIQLSSSHSAATLHWRLLSPPTHDVLRWSPTAAGSTSWYWSSIALDAHPCSWNMHFRSCALEVCTNSRIFRWQPMEGSRCQQAARWTVRRVLWTSGDSRYAASIVWAHSKSVKNCGRPMERSVHWWTWGTHFSRRWAPLYRLLSEKGLLLSEVIRRRKQRIMKPITLSAHSVS